MSINQTLERIRKFRTDKGWSINKLAKTAGVAEATLRKIDDDNWNPETRTLQRLEAVVTAEQGAR
jgi:ribosome-binding protein aMBF1 (putative translation factor)